MDDRLALMDQGSFLGWRALGHQPCTLLTWTYDRPVDLPALNRFNENLAATLIGRLVEVSPLPGGRHRWAALDTVPALEMEPSPRPRSEIHAWTDELADRGVDPERGPGWRIGVLPLVDGGTAIAMVGSHTLGDGMCKLAAIAAAATGSGRRPSYPVRGRRRRFAVLCADLVDLLRAAPALVRAVVAGVRMARAHPRAVAGRPEPPAARPEAATGPFHAPAACVRVRQDDWDAAARRLGGTSNSLASAVAASLGQRLGRVASDGTVSLAVPVSVRVPGDTRANALDQVVVVVDPAVLTEDLSGLRAATKAALAARANEVHDLAAVLPLVPLTPRSVVRRAEQFAMGSSVAPVGCSNHGEVPIDVMRIDGADADDFWVRLCEPGQAAADLDRIGGQAYVLCGRALGRIYVSVVAYPVGHGGLDELVAQVLAGFGLTAVDG